MRFVLILNRITGTNYDFLKMGYFSCFQGGGGGRNLSKFSVMSISSE